MFVLRDSHLIDLLLGHFNVFYPKVPSMLFLLLLYCWLFDLDLLGPNTLDVGVCCHCRLLCYGIPVQQYMLEAVELLAE